jgi:hypothetical protein
MGVFPGISINTGYFPVPSPTLDTRPLHDSQGGAGPVAQTILKVVLREYQQGRPVSGARMEILSHNWQVPVGQPYAVIARGETDAEGAVSFDVTTWPSNGYRFRFSPTARTQPAGLYFMPENENQFRGYPGNIIEGSAAAQRGETLQTLYFVLVTNGLVENDLSFGQGRPQYQQAVPEVGYGYYAGFTPVDGKSYVATALAGTATARQRGEPDPTRPPPPPPYTPGNPQQALSAGTQPVAGSTQTSGVVATGTQTSGAGASGTQNGTQNPSANTTFEPGNTQGTQNTQISPSGTLPSAQKTPVPTIFGSPGLEVGQRIIQTLLALGALAFLIIFLRYRQQFYRLVGFDTRPKNRVQRESVTRKRKKHRNRNMEKAIDLARVEQFVNPREEVSSVEEKE